VSHPSAGEVVLFGRSSSHFTRITRIVAAECGVEYEFRILRDLFSSEPADYGGNPALRVPALRSPRGLWLGAGNIAREFARLSRQSPRLVWSEDVADAVVADAQELVLESMATEVTLVMAGMAGAAMGNPLHAKRTQSLRNMLGWLELNVERVLAALPQPRDLSYLEVSLYCLITHLEFRQVLPVAPFEALNHFRLDFEQRPSAQHTTYRMDT
jgi:glutathione S-transferase